MDRGAALVTVLGGLMLVGAITFAALFAVTLEAMAARSAQRAAQDGAALQAALAVAAAETVTGPAPGAGVLGPWPHLGVSASVTVAVPEPGVRVLEVRLPGPTLPPHARLVIQLEPEPLVLWRP